MSGSHGRDIVLGLRWLTRIAELVSSEFRNNQDKYSDKNSCVHTHKPPPLNKNWI